MLDPFVSEFLHQLLSEAGCIAVILLFTTCYQTKQLNKERTENKSLNANILNLATTQVSANKEVQLILEKVIDAVAADRQGARNDT